VPSPDDGGEIFRLGLRAIEFQGSMGRSTHDSSALTFYIFFRAWLND
jgi:hypothetical protein